MAKNEKEHIVDTTKLKAILKQREMSQQELADGLNKKKGYVSRVVNGHIKMNEVTICEFCQYLNVSPNDILPWEEWLEYAAQQKKKAKKGK